MNAIRITSLSAIAIASISIVVVSQLSEGGRFASHTFGYVTLGLGVISLILDFFKTRRKKAIALMVTGMTLVVFGERIPGMLIAAISKQEGRISFFDFAAGFMVLGVSCVAFSWIILLIDADVKDSEK